MGQQGPPCTPLLGPIRLSCPVFVYVIKNSFTLTFLKMSAKGIPKLTFLPITFYDRQRHSFGIFTHVFVYEESNNSFYNTPICFIIIFANQNDRQSDYIVDIFSYNFFSITDTDMILVSLPMLLCMGNPIIHFTTLYYVLL